MKNTSTEFNTIAENPFGAKYIHKIIDLTNNTEIKDDIDDFLYSAMINDDDVFTIGNTCSATISFSIINPTVNLNNKEIEVYQGLDINGTVEYIKLGVFKVLKPKKDRSITKYQCVDRMTYLMNMPYSSNLTFPTTDVKILQEICSQVEISLVQNGLISHSISKKPSGYTKREIIAYISQLQGKNARINSDGNLELIWYTDTDYVVDDNKIYYDGTSDVNSEIDYKVEYLECTVRSLDGTDETVIKAGSGANGIKIENPFMTQTILYELANKLVGFTFRGAEFEFLGDFRLEVGDIVSVETNGEVYRVPIMQIEHKSDGGVVTTITSVGETDTENEIDLSSPNIHAMDRYYAELVLINKAMINKLSVDEADIRYLQVEQLDAIEANIENAVIKNLEGEFITVDVLDAERARITVLEANSLTSDSAIIKELEAGITKTNTLIFGSASGDTIQTSFSNSVIAQLGDAQIESAMIKEISALKITGLDLNTTKFTVHSEDGLSQWKDNTITIHDGVLGTPRIQIGKDGSGDYNMYIWNAQGKLMFDALGLTENGISRQIIRNDVVKDDANINATKLNIESLFNVINDETSYMLKSSKIWIDSEKQTLDISFKVMSSNVSDLQETQISQGTDIETIQGQISSKIWQQDITKSIDSINIGGRNLIRASYVVNFEGSTDTSKFISSGTVTHTSAHENGGFRCDSRDCYEVNTKYVLSGYITIVSGIIENFYIHNGKSHIFESFKIDGVSYGDPLSKKVTNANDILNDGEKHYFELHFVTNNTIANDYFIYYTHFQINKGSEAEISYIISGLKLEKGTKTTDWTPAPEDTEANITALNTQYSSIDQTVNSISGTVASHTTQIQEKADAKTVTKISDNLTLMQADLDGFKTTVSNTYTTKTDFNNLQIGGRNLAQKTSSEYSKEYTNFSGATNTEISVSKVLTDGLSVGDVVTVRIICKYTEIVAASNQTATIRVQGAGDITSWNNGAFTPSPKYNLSGSGEKEILYRFTVDTNHVLNNYWSAGFRTDYIQSGSIQWKMFKVEKGTKATDWTPAPEAIDTELESTKSIATQTSEMMDWLVESGTSATNFTLTDRMAELTAQIINLNGNVKVSGDMLVDGAITADKLATDAIKSRNFEIDATTGNITQGMYINLQDGTLNSRYVSWDNKGKLKATSVDLSGNINATTGAIGNWVLDDDGYLYAKTLVGTTTAGTLYKTYLKASSGSYDSVVVGSSIASASSEDLEEWMFRINADGTIITKGQLSVYSTDGITTTGPITTTKKMSCNDGCYINGKTELHGNGLELYYTTPYIDFHYNNNSDDHTARIAENSKGALTVYNSISNASDRRLKQDISDLDKKYLNALNLFNPVSYRFIKGSDNLYLGFIAQDIEKALIDSGITDLPLISKDDNGIYSLDYSQITALNTLGHLDHEERIQQLENNLAVANALIQSLLIQQSTV